MTDPPAAPTSFNPAITVFVLVKMLPEWLGFPVEKRIAELSAHVAPVPKKHAANVRLRFYDVEFYSARVTDIWVWDASDHQAYQLPIEDLRETPFWDRYFEIVEILPGVQNAYADNHDREALTA